jgi:methylthioribose-1-phosphate isomerase
LKGIKAVDRPSARGGDLDGSEVEMRIGGEHRRTVWLAEDGRTVATFDQTRLPHALPVIALEKLADAARAIREMKVRGAPLIGAIAAYGVALAMHADPSDAALDEACATLAATRPTAVNLRWALERMRAVLAPLAPGEREARAYAEAAAICEEDVAVNRAIGERGLPLIEAVARRKRPGEPVNILTHCNAGWLATIDWGTATAPIYLAHRKGIPVHVWVDETRPRNQGAAITAFELGQEGVPHTVIADNAGGHLMRRGMVDLCLVGTDRVARNGDVANKIGTYLKALAAFDNGVPFYVALPSSTIDRRLPDGSAIPIEERSGEELALLSGRTRDGRIETVRITPDGSPCGNWAFDVTPARLVTAFVTERGVCPANEAGLLSLFPERAAA